MPRERPRGERDDREERRERRPRPARDGTTDDQVVALRETGRSYAAIARTLGIKRSGGAQDSFMRALRVRATAERASMLERELGRLGSLEARIRERDSAEPEKLERRLTALDVLRQKMRDAGDTDTAATP